MQSHYRVRTVFKLSISLAAAWLFGSAVAQAQTAAKAIEWRSLAAPAILYDAPSAKAKALYLGPKGMPVEALVTLDTFVKVRDLEGGVMWVEKKNLNEAKAASATSVLARQALSVRQSADDNASEVFSIARGVLLEPQEPAKNGWVRVKHRDGQSGYAKVADLFGM